MALPYLESLAAPVSKIASSTAGTGKKMIFLGGGFGFTKDTFYPKKSGKFEEIGLTEGLAPLERHLSDITMVSNLTNRGATNPHGGSSSYLTGANVAGTPGKRFHNSISCDQLAAEQLSSDTRFSSLVLSAKEKDGLQQSGHGAGLSLSWDHDGKPIPGANRPLDLYHKLFSTAEESKGELVKRLQAKQSVMDLLKLEAGGLKRKLSKVDVEKLDEYFTGVRQVEKGLERQAKWVDIPKMRAPFDVPDEGVKGEEAIHLMYDMIIIALQTGMTNVVSYRQPVCSLLSGMGVSLKAHSLSHYGFSKPRTEASRERDKKCMTLFAHFIDRLKEAKDIEGKPLYDSCIVSYGSNLRSGHELKNLPALLTGGGAEGIKHGRHLKLPKQNTPLANYWLTLMQQAGVSLDSFSHSDGIIDELLHA